MLCTSPTGTSLVTSTWIGSNWMSAPPVTASASQIVYDTRTATVDLSGGVQLARGTDQLSSGQVTYNLAARRITASGDGASQVHITIQPPQNDAAKPQPKPKKKR